MSRTRNSIKNSLVSVFFQTIELLLNFLVRIFFIKYLTKTDLGINGLFTNILNVLSLAELGIGEAINFSMYKPLAEKDFNTIGKILNYYKKVYLAIGGIITILSILLMPFLGLFLGGVEYSNRIAVIYLLFVANTTVSYLFSYKRNLLIADQKTYITAILKFIFYTIFKVLQIVYLTIWKNFIGYLVLQVIETILEYFSIAIAANKIYPFLKKKSDEKINEKYKKEIVKNTKAMMLHKIGDVVVNSTDNILISKIIGIEAVGIYSNYYMITSSLNLIYSQIFSAITSSVGNLCVDEDENKKYNIFCRLDFLTFILFGISSIILYNVFNDFILMWVGKEYLFSNLIVIIICLNFYLAGMRKAVQTFREATGLYYKDKWKAIVEALVNIIFSIILGKKYGIAGIFIGTTITYLTTCSFIEPFVLYKYCFNTRFIKYIFEFVKRITIIILIILLSSIICNLIKFNLILRFIAKILISTFIGCLIIYIFYYKDSNFHWILSLCKNKIKKI